MSGLKRVAICFMAVLAMTFVLPDFSGTAEIKGKTNAYLNYSWITLNAGSSMKLKVKGTSKKVKWKSSNKKIAKVNKKGKVTGKKAGKCTITAKVKGKKLKCKVTVTGKAPKKVTAFKKTTLNVLGLKLDIHDVTYGTDGKVLISDNKGTYKVEVLNSSGKVTWKSSNTGVATVNNGTITAVAKGSCTISAVINKTSYKCTLVVTDLKDAEQIAKQKYIYEMLGYVNKDRVKVKVAPLKIKEEINKVADLRAGEICKKGQFSHTRPNGKAFTTAYADTGFKVGTYVGENLAYFADKTEYLASFTKNAYKALYNQKEHRELMLNAKYEYIGISYSKTDVYKNGNGSLCVATYWAQEFYTK
ncbi:MAG: Ig-like domain-containing protein [Eubacterium sp.]